MKKLPLLLLALLIGNFVVAQKYYTIQVGTFLEAKRSDFEAIQSVGMVHAKPLSGNLSQIYVGGYESREAAEKALEQVKAKGYANAFVQERSPAEGQEVAVIQLATKSSLQMVEWDTYLKAGELYAILNGPSIRIATGLYPNAEAAKLYLNAMRQLGFADAFIRTINTIFLTKLTAFETGIVSPLPTTPVLPTLSPTNSPTAYDQPVIPPGMTPRDPKGNTPVLAAPMATQPAMPRVHADVKRRSVLELQKILKIEGYYKSSLDGYYGDGTATAYRKMRESNRELQKYAILAQHFNPGDNVSTGNQLQDAINKLTTDPNAVRTIESSNVSLAKGYRAYLSYVRNGKSAEVNTLMNTAIRESFVGKKFKTPPPFDYQATYAYENLEQLLLHLQYLHSAPGNDIAAPCWLFLRHPREMQRVFERYASVATPGFLIQSCDQFLTWEDLRIVHTIAADLNPDKKLDEKKIAQGASLRAMLYLAPEALDPAVAKELQTWNDKLFTGLNGWASRDPVNQRIVQAFKAGYLHAQVRLEDFFLDKGFKDADAKPLALATLRTIVGYHLERFSS